MLTSDPGPNQRIPLQGRSRDRERPILAGLRHDAATPWPCRSRTAAAKPVLNPAPRPRHQAMAGGDDRGARSGPGRRGGSGGRATRRRRVRAVRPRADRSHRTKRDASLDSGRRCLTLRHRDGHPARSHHATSRGRPHLHPAASPAPDASLPSPGGSSRRALVKDRLGHLRPVQCSAATRRRPGWRRDGQRCPGGRQGRADRVNANERGKLRRRGRAAGGHALAALAAQSAATSTATTTTSTASASASASASVRSDSEGGGDGSR